MSMSKYKERGLSNPISENCAHARDIGCHLRVSSFLVWRILVGIVGLGFLVLCVGWCSFCRASEYERRVFAR